MVDKKDLYRQIYLKVDFGLNGDNQIVQKEIPELVQYDNNSGLLVFDFYNNGRKIDLTNTRVVVNFKLPSGDGFHDEVLNIHPNESRAMYFIPMGVLTEVGTVIGDIALYKDDAQITSSVKFQYKVIEGINTTSIVDNEKYPILLSLMNQVKELVDSSYQWEEDFHSKYNEIVQEIETAQSQFASQRETFNQDFNSHLDTQEQRFNNKYQEIDAMFNQGDINAMFQEKFERLEQDFAQDYTDMKQTVREVYDTTLKYRIVE